MVYDWGDSRRFNSYSSYFKRIFGGRIQKVTVNAGFTCPNRDGMLGINGCTFCDNNAFTPSYCMKGGDVEWQIKEGIEFHRRRYRNAEKFLVYFQSFSNTYGSLNRLKEIYGQAFLHPDVAGIVVGTRPDCIDDEKLDYFSSLAKKYYVAIEYGIESCYDQTLARINRGHGFECAREAVCATAERGINVGAHFILGLPGESEDMLLEQMSIINNLPLNTIKFHQLQIFKKTRMAEEYAANPEAFKFWSMEEYISFFAEMLRRLRPDIVVERFAGEAPPRFHVGPTWGLVRNEQLLVMFEKYLEDNGFYQGQLYARG